LNPKNHKDFKEGIAEKVGVHQDVVDDFVNFYYSKLRKNLSNLTYPSIMITGLGTFTIRQKIIDKEIKKTKSILGNLAKRTYDGYEKHVGIKEKLEMLENMQTMLDEINQEKKDFKSKQKWI